LPQATIKVGGNFDDWKDILPAFSAVGSPKKGIVPSLVIDKVYLAVDEKNLYLRFDIKDMTPSSTDHPQIFYMGKNCTYTVDLLNRAYHITAHVNFDAKRNGWFTALGLHENVKWVRDIDLTYGNLAMKGSSLEAYFSLKSIRNNLGVDGTQVEFNEVTGCFDSQWNWLEGSGDKTESKQFTFPTSAKADAVVEASVEAAPKETLSNGDPLPQASIKIDGNFDDWNGILPAFTFGTLSPKNKSLAIDKVYLAVDAKNLYMKIDMKDIRPSYFFNTHNFDTQSHSTYGPKFDIGANQVTVDVQFDNSPKNNHWYTVIGKRVSGGSWELIGMYGNYDMKGSSLEASFPLDPIKQNLGVLGTQGHFRIFAATGELDSQGNLVEGSNDYTDKKVFIF
jgi:hypothetical protein